MILSPSGISGPAGSAGLVMCSRCPPFGEQFGEPDSEEVIQVRRLLENGPALRRSVADQLQRLASEPGLLPVDAGVKAARLERARRVKADPVDSLASRPRPPNRPVVL